MLNYLYFIFYTSLPCTRCFVMSREFLGNANSTIIIINFVKNIFCQNIIYCSALKCTTFFILLFGARITKFDGFPSREHPTFPFSTQFTKLFVFKDCQTQTKRPSVFKL